MYFQAGTGTAAADTSQRVQLAVCVTGYLRTLHHTWPSAKAALFCAGTARYPCADAFLGLYYSQHDTAIHSMVPDAGQIQDEETFIAGVRNEAEVRWLDVSNYNESHHAVHGLLHAPFISQGRRVGHCLRAVHTYQTAQRRAPYSLVMRTRTDVVYPAQPLPIDQLLEALRGTRSCTPLLIPLANDGRGVNDQIALGALSTMEQYGGWGDALASADFSHGRTYHSRRVPPHEEWCIPLPRKNPFAALDSALRLVDSTRAYGLRWCCRVCAFARRLKAFLIQRHGLCFRRFWYEYALLRGTHVRVFDALGAEAFTEYYHDASNAAAADRTRLASAMHTLTPSC